MVRKAGVPHPRLPLPAAGQGDDLAVFQRWLGEAIPLVRQLGLNGMAWQGDALVWNLELEPNLNDKGTGFGGSLTAQATLIGWCWTTLWLRSRGLLQDVVVATASQRFLAPVTADYRLECLPRDAEGPRGLQERLDTKGKGRIVLVQRLYANDTLCLEAEGDYAVLPAPPSA
ncbi:thioesterase domain-containing protein, putative [Modicisalibacter ilicicola DSM 19980]|uniref:Thioesterase domain-containing protein, putative n=1 Tax=Modicisalibacter ilicicola DSM 19980 TaxID=1121942 RepID=A0A1M4YE57_9GAMM|nr:YiiD C-terminal domain-containing protein [Halomonas ilicicola]SHF03746.1 thioesterase domain-containing protein, putative [Halomonas ilicicola DSM 19980]